jgi:hypothetical protein
VLQDTQQTVNIGGSAAQVLSDVTETRLCRYISSDGSLFHMPVCEQGQ